ncbi:SDR family NAD(P)-dependent oxidoreductase [Paenactinomyces guangxiensis]|uniref:SDR family oxidoreductase n=1 Tax=Paenactinomyces guangxiensis TaxID=1490290 RepID=A0A7W1WQY2_9BACL|nr:SDR family oxidoreductase [Paenactinomyces guangxiensis]MBA4494323.1 SDR family oxidoreductase [Paenactinomyces guangxiensis]MBH8590818.1 SDR family oxidoreductase [Paenactinomyces guangxiensis]
MKYCLQKDVAIVTGGASGIGRGIAEALLQAGSSVLIADVNEARASDTVKELQAKYGKEKTAYHVADLRQHSAAEQVVEAALQSFGSIDILVNCAGLYPSTNALQIDESEWDVVFDVNVKAVFFLSQAAAKVMIRQGKGGRIINVTSTASEVARPGVAHYCSSKAAAKMLTQVLALEWAKHGIRVNALGPGLVETETLLSTLVTEDAVREHQEKLSYCPMNRAALIEEIAEGVLFFATDQSRYVTGQTLLIDGGYSAGRVFQSK